MSTDVLNIEKTLHGYDQYLHKGFSDGYRSNKILLAYIKALRQITYRRFGENSRCILIGSGMSGAHIGVVATFLYPREFIYFDSKKINDIYSFGSSHYDYPFSCSIIIDDYINNGKTINSIISNIKDYILENKESEFIPFLQKFDIVVIKKCLMFNLKKINTFSRNNRIHILTNKNWLKGVGHDTLTFTDSEE